MKQATVKLPSGKTEKDVCSRCGAEYEDILGIGICGECFYGTPTASLDSLAGSLGISKPFVILKLKDNDNTRRK